jgi:tripartite-type tricarboxylate transporter receptor subunit TctC
MVELLHRSKELATKEGTVSPIITSLVTRFAILLAATAVSVSKVAADSYPDRTIKIVAGFPAGSAPDTTARLLAEKLQVAWGKPVIVENTTGASGNIAADRVAKSSADGYTLLMAGNASIVVSPSLYDKLPYDPVKDLLPISLVTMTPNILALHPDVPAKSVAELVALARAQPDGLTYGHGGAGISQHLAGELFKHMAGGLAIRPVGFRGAALIMPEILAGRVNLCFCNITNVLPLAREGKLRALAVTSRKRSAAAPELPTMDESGFPGFDATAWFGLMAPAGTPSEVVEKLHAETVKALATPDLRAKFDAIGMEVIGNTPAEFAAMIKTEIPYWAKVMKAIDLKLK